MSSKIILHFSFHLFIYIIMINQVDASVGENSMVYQKCLRKYMEKNCSNAEKQIAFFAQQPPIENLLGWSCVDEVRYRCMWRTVRAFVKEDLPVPQFHGKWPFRRYYGMQEPASVVFSLFNLIACAIMLIRIYRAKDIQNELRPMWMQYAALGMFTWLWSTVFHARDNGFTERMDYFSAFACVLFKLFSVVARLTRKPYPMVYNFASAPFIGFYIYHVYRLNDSPKFDYGYNMLVSVCIAACSSVLWLAYVAHSCWQTPARVSKMWRCAFVVISANLLLCLELFDFPPIMWTFDAHSLWHLGTAPLPIFWAQFVIDDLRHIDDLDMKEAAVMGEQIKKQLAEMEKNERETKKKDTKENKKSK